MSVERSGRGIAFSCDRCPESFEPDEPGDFTEVWAAAKVDGWRARQTRAGKWEHLCPGCVREDD